jgi:prevent-host-death family protein
MSIDRFEGAQVVNVHEAKTHLSRLLEAVSRGEDVVIAKAGRPVARLVAIGSAGGGRRPGGVVGRLDDEFFDSLPDDDLVAWGL